MYDTTSPLTSAKIHLFACPEQTTPIKTLWLSEALESIRSWMYERRVDPCREALKRGDKAAYDELKSKLPAWTFCGTFKPTRANSNLQQHTGIVHGDIDHIDLLTVLNMHDAISKHPCTAYVFRSTGGMGLKVGVRVPIVADDAAYKHAWHAVKDYYEQTFGGTWDPSGKDIARLCFVSYDVSLYMNLQATCFDVPPMPPPIPMKVTTPTRRTRTRSTDRRDDYAQQALETATRMIDNSQPGNRHEHRLKASRLLGGYVAGGILSYDQGYTALEAAVRGNTEDFDRSMKTIKDGLAHGQDKPFNLNDLEAERQAWLDSHGYTSNRHTPQQNRISESADSAPEDEALYGESEPKKTGVRWKFKLSRTKSKEVRETLGNVTLALQHLEPWASTCWYDVVRDLRMVGEHELDDITVTKASLAIEAATKMPMRSRHLVPTALTYLCYQTRRDLLHEWLHSLPRWDEEPRLNSWLPTYAHAPRGAYSEDVGRMLLVGMVARVEDPGCQYRYVVIFEGPENAGKTKLVRSLSTPDWYRELSHGLDGKEAHMRLKRAWVAELAELSSLSRTEEARLKSFFTLNEDAYIPKFSNFEVVHKRRTVFIGTVNPEGDNTYLRGQTGNTRYLPITVDNIDLDGFAQIRSQLFAEALQYYRVHPADWWKLSAKGESKAEEAREDRRQRSVYEDELGAWLERSKKDITWWEELARDFLLLPRAQWPERRTQMEVMKALKALGWDKGKRKRVKDVGLIVPWEPGGDWHPEE